MIELLNTYIFLVPFCIALVFLGFAVVLEVKSRTLLRRHAPRLFLYATGLILMYLIYIGYLQFLAFYEGGLVTPILGTGKGLLWFLSYIQLHFWNDYLVSLPAGILVALIGYYFNKKYAERFFEPEELYLAALGILLVGYPGFLFYLPLVLILSVAGSLLFVRRGERLPLYHFWIPTALVVLLVIQFWARNEEWWTSFRF